MSRFVILLLVVFAFSSSSLCLALKLFFNPDDRRYPSEHLINSAPAADEFYVISDFHMDPFLGTPMAANESARHHHSCTEPSVPAHGRYMCDAPPALVESAINDLFKDASGDGSSGLVLVLGDFLRHRMNQFENKSSGCVDGMPCYRANEYKQANQIVGSIATMIHNAVEKNQKKSQANHHHVFAHAQPPAFKPIPLMGNEDMIPDYHFNVSGSVHPALAANVKAMYDNAFLTKEEAAQYGQCGFYSRVINSSGSQPSIRIIAMNTILYSLEHHPHHDRKIADPCGQLSWLGQQLEAARNNNQAAYVTGHIVPDTTKWYPDYLQAFQNIIVTYRDTISAVWMAHVHMFEFLLLDEQKDEAPPVFTSAAITPMDGNNPNYYRVSVRGALSNSKKKTSNLTEAQPCASGDFRCMWEVLHIHQRYLDIADEAPTTFTWKDSQDFGKDFGITKHLSPKTLREYATGLLSKSKHSKSWLDFQKFHFGQATFKHAILGKHAKRTLLCRMLNWKLSDYETCRDDPKYLL